MLWRRFETLQMREHANPRRDDRREFCASHDRDDAGDPPRLCGIDPDDFRMRMGERRNATCTIRGNSMSLT